MSLLFATEIDLIAFLAPHCASRGTLMADKHISDLRGSAPQNAKIRFTGAIDGLKCRILSFGCAVVMVELESELIPPEGTCLLSADRYKDEIFEILWYNGRKICMKLVT